jgi:hypothetical protein
MAPIELGARLGDFGSAAADPVHRPVPDRDRGAGEVYRASRRGIQCEREVKLILVPGGRATGIELTDGETYLARDAVIGASSTLSGSDHYHCI